MRITTRGRYGLRAMIELARHRGPTPLMMGEIARALGISRKYLHAQLRSLKDEGLVTSVRGSAGGYHLTRPASEITVAEIISALEGCDSLVDCVEDPEACDRCNECITRGLWRDLGKVIQSYLSGITLQDLAARKSSRART